MADAIALIVAGSGEVSDKEVFDLIEDWAGGMGDADVTLVVPVSKSLYSDAVDYAIDWYLADADADPKEIATVKVDGENASRKSSAVGDGPEEVAEFGDIFSNLDDFDKVEFFIALPEPGTDGYEDHITWLEAAEAAKTDVTVRNLCRGLDDVVMIEPDEPEPEVEPEPAPEPEKPARRSRAKAAPEPESDPDPVEEEVKPKRASRAKKSEPDVVSETVRASAAMPDLAEVLAALREVGKYLNLADVSNALFFQQEFEERPLNARYRKVVESLTDFLVGVSEDESPVAAEEAQDEPTEAPKRGRGRPRENFEVKEIHDDEDGWIPRPRGRLAKGTKWRVRDDRDDSILDEGVA